MKSWIRVLTIVALVSALVATGLVLRRPDDPRVKGRAASDWVRDLLSTDYRVRGEAQSSLLTLQREAVPQVRRLLRRRDHFWRPYTTRFGGHLPFLQDDGLDPTLCHVRGSEMIALLGPAGREAIPDLIQCLADSQAVTETERALLRVGDSSRPALIAALRLRNPEIRAHAARLLSHFLPDSADCVAPLLGSLRDENAVVRKAAATSLGASRGEPRVIAALLRSTRDEIAEVRAASYESLGRLHRNLPEVTNATRVGLTDLIPQVRLEAAKALWELTRDRDAVVPVLSGILSTQEGWQAAYVLGSMGADAAPAVPALIEVLRREKVSRAFRTPPSSSLALGQIQAAAIPELKKVLHDREPGVRLSAVLAFNLMGANAHSAIPELLELLHDPDSEIRNVTAITLAAAGADKNLVLGGLQECLRAEDIYMRSTAAALLRELAPERDWAVSPE